MEWETHSHHTKTRESNEKEKNNNEIVLDHQDLELCEKEIESTYTQTKGRKILKFFFPLWPLKIFKNVHLITFLASMLALRFVLSYLSLPIRPFGFKISFAWLPIYVAGFFLGPVAGMLFGAACDSIGYACNGGIWFWMYAIQEPTVGLLAGLMGSIYYLIKSHKIKVVMIFQKIITYSFICFTIFMVVYEYYILNARFAVGGIQKLNIFVPVSIAVMLIYFIVNEVQTDLLYKKIKTQRRQEYFVMYCYISKLVIIITTLFSFILGPTIFVEFIRYSTGLTPSNYLRYGSMFYLVPRVLKEAVKTPIYIALLTGIVFAIRTPMAQLYNLGFNKW